MIVLRRDSVTVVSAAILPRRITPPVMGSLLSFRLCRLECYLVTVRGVPVVSIRLYPSDHGIFHFLPCSGDGPLSGSGYAVCLPLTLTLARRMPVTDSRLCEE